MHPAVVEGALGDIREEAEAQVYHRLVDLAQIDARNGGVLEDLAQHAAVAAADDQHPLGASSESSGVCAIISW